MDGVTFHVMGMKEPDYVLLFMSTYGSSVRVGRTLKRGAFTFKYPEVAYMHYTHRDSVDNHNSRRMYPIALEEEIGTSRWAFLVFTFLLAVTDVNVNLLNAGVFGGELEDQVNHRFNLADELIKNPYIGHEGVGGIVTRSTTTEEEKPKEKVHDKLSIPKK